ncbi:MAG: protein kinase, partial [Polyangiaceae bacterium]|nr:protein kinase [Polyangiaceae bacterium]
MSVEQQDRFGLVGHTIAATFRVDAVVAEGGFGVVYRAYHLHFRSAVALKCLKIPTDLSDAERGDFLEQFRSEAEVMFRLSASLPNIVRPLHVDAVQTEAGEFVPFMALEWLEGKTFETIIEERAEASRPPLRLTEVVSWLSPVAYALDSAHRFEGPEGLMAIIHRDIKPDNLFLTNLGTGKIVKILDFGISKVRRAATQLAGHYSQTSGQAPFSPAYGAPEQWIPKRYGQTGPWTDVWGLALTLVEILKGDAVIIGDQQSMMGTILDLARRPTPQNEGVPLPDHINAIFEKGLAVDPRYRYQTVRAFWEALLAAISTDKSKSQSQRDLSAQQRPVNPFHSSLSSIREPTPWSAPETLPESLPSIIDALPPMVAPGPQEIRATTQSEAQASLPKDPHSGLAPVPASAPLYNEEDLNIPRLSDKGDDIFELEQLVAPIPRPHQKEDTARPFPSSQRTRSAPPSSDRHKAMIRLHRWIDHRSGHAPAFQPSSHGKEDPQSSRYIIADQDSLEPGSEEPGSKARRRVEKKPLAEQEHSGDHNPEALIDDSTAPETVSPTIS